jgi:hypothetical protein
VSYHVDCPHCQCRWEDDVPRLVVNKDAPFYPLVVMVDALRARPERVIYNGGVDECPGDAANVPGPAEHSGGVRHG